MFLRGAAVLAGLVLVVTLFSSQSASAANAPGLSNGYSGWNWGSPNPQGNSLYDVQFVGDVGYASGEGGTLLKTVNGGRTWSNISSSIEDDLISTADFDSSELEDIQLLSSNSLVVSSSCEMWRSDDGGKSFTNIVQCSMLSKDVINSFFFVDKKLGFMLSTGGSLYRTTDGGLNWSVKKKRPLSKKRVLRNITFISSKVGLATSGESIYRTTNQGESWVEVERAGATLYELYFADKSTGYATGDRRNLRKTTDGGRTWVNIDISSKYFSEEDSSTALYGIDCAGSSGSNCLITTDRNMMIRTVNGGATWKVRRPSSTSATVEGINDDEHIEIYAAASFVTPSRAVVVGWQGLIFTSGDAGAKWSRVGSSLGDYYVTGDTLKAVSGRVAVVAPFWDSRGQFLRTVDAGKSWRFVDVKTKAHVLDLSFLSAKRGFVITNKGELLSTKDGGKRWALLRKGKKSILGRVHAFDDRNVLLLESGRVLSSTDGGKGFRDISDQGFEGMSFNSFKGFGNSVAVAFEKRDEGAKGGEALLTTDAGKSWRKIELPNSSMLINDLQFIDGQLGYLAEYSYATAWLWKTEDGGKTWTRQKELTSLSADVDKLNEVTVAFDGPKSGYIRERESHFGFAQTYVYRTTDGGASWRPQLVSLAAGGVGLAAADGTAYLSTRDYDGDPWDGYSGDYRNLSQLFSTTNGGDLGAPSDLKFTTETKKISKSALKDAGNKFTITGRLSGVKKGEKVIVSRGNGYVSREVVAVAADGTFSVTFKDVEETTYFVAEYVGRTKHSSAATELFTLEVF